MDIFLGNPVSGARVLVDSINHAMVTTGSGEYWRVLPPGQYKLMAVSGDTRSQPVTVQVRH